MAASGTKTFPRCKKEFSTPLTYSEYDENSLNDPAPEPILPEGIGNKNNRNDPHNLTSNPQSSKVLLNKLNQNMIVVVNITGTRFEISRATYSKLEPAILDSSDSTLVQINQTTGYPEIFIERHPACFAAILDYHLCGELHMPSDTCPSVFQRELKYWKLESNVMESCCLRRYAAFRSNEQTLSDCHQTFTQWRDKQPSHPSTKWGRFRKKGWATMDDPKSGMLAKLYLCTASFFVVLSIFLLAASTDANFNRDLNANEWEEFMSYDDLYTHWEHIYPGKDKPDKNKNTQQAGGADFSTAAPDNPPPGPGPGRKKRSVPDDPRYVRDGDVDIGPGEDRPKNVGDSQKQNAEKTSNNPDIINGFERNLNEKKRSDVKKPLAQLSEFVRKSVRTVLNEFTKDGYVVNDEAITQNMVDEAMVNYVDSLKKRIREMMKENQESLKGSVNKNAQGSPFVESFDVEYTEQEDPLRFDDLYPSPDSVDVQNERKIRQKRSASTSNETEYLNITQFFDSDCIKLSGSQVDYLITHLTLAALNSDYNYSNLPSATSVYKWVDILETICMAYFTVEFVLRILFAPSLLKFLFSFLTMMDLVSLATMYVSMVVQFMMPELKYTESAMDAVNCLQIARVFRFFRLVKDVIGFRVLLLSVKTSWRELLLLLLYIVMAVTIFATVVYFCERENMKSIPEAAWWAIVTMTTVGYGDMTPKTLQGRLTGMACAMSGVLLIAVTVPIFVNNFILFYEYSKISMDSELYHDSKTGKRKESNAADENNSSGTKCDQKNYPNSNTTQQTRPHKSCSDAPTGKLFQQTSTESNASSDIGLEPMTTSSSPSSSWVSSTKTQLSEMDSGSLISRTDSSKSLTSRGTTASKGYHSSPDYKSPEVKSVSSLSKVTPVVYDLKSEQDIRSNNNIAHGRKPAVGRNKRTNKQVSLA